MLSNQENSQIIKIFYIDIEKFKNNHNKDFLSCYADKELKTEKRFYEYTIGRYLIKQAAKKFYNIENPEITVNKKGKPVFKNSGLHFSLSHSKNIAVVCFSQQPCGIDIEYIKSRNLEKLSKYFKKDFNTSDDFYKFWTLKEAEYKLNDVANYHYCTKFLNDYYLTVVSPSMPEIQITEFFE